jgi:hypothetical protein
MKTYWGSGGIAPRLLDLDTRCRWLARFTSRATLPPGKEPPVPVGYEAGWAPEPVWTRHRREKFPAPVGNRTPIIISSRASHYTDWAIPAHNVQNTNIMSKHQPIKNAPHLMGEHKHKTFRHSQNFLYSGHVKELKSYGLQIWRAIMSRGNPAKGWSSSAGFTRVPKSPPPL